jgi:hypothetical protein
VKADKHAVVPPVEPTSYYGKPIVKAPVWKPEVPWYFFTGGLAGASAVLAQVASATGNDAVAAAARRVGAMGALASPVLLISDLGQPRRFLNMLRVFRPTSPLSMGSWTLFTFAPAAAGSWLLHEVDVLPRVGRLAGAVAALLGPVMSTYTGVLVADTAIPAWHEAHRHLPFLFSASSAASAGAVVTMLVEPVAAAPARRLAISGAVAGVAATEAMKQHLGDLGDVYERGRAGAFARAATGLLAAGAAMLAGAGRRRPGAVLGGALVTGGVICERWAIFSAGPQSAADPQHTVGPQVARDRRAR